MTQLKTCIAALVISILLLAGAVAPAAAEPVVHAAEIGRMLPLWSVLPFVGMLLSIALFPLLAPHFWHHHYPKVALAWSLLFGLPFLAVYRGAAMAEIAHIYVVDYIPFIILLWGLFTTAGGILVRGRLAGTPKVNALLLLIGTFVASWIGTTGAAMLMIRPVLRANANRRRKMHIVIFFIFLIANIGGALTPLGDPPLFLGFLHHVPFFWTLRLIGPMGFMVAALLAIFYFIDRHHYIREEPARHVQPEDKADPLRIDGAYNLLFVAGIVGAVLLSGVWHPGDVEVFGIPTGLQDLLRDILILLMGGLSLHFTPQQVHSDNQFGWEPIREVAFLFAGIFMTIIPALAILKAGESGHLAFVVRAVRDPAHYFWVTGALSSFLDNAPTYLTFFNSQLGRFYPGMPEHQAVAQLVATKAVYLEALASGAVFMGANTYIGNAPNFMVKSIAEEQGVAMPSFFGYILRWSLPILIPLFLLVTFIFYR